jgi:transposase
MTALRVHEELRGRGFTGKYTIVKDLVRRLRPETRRQPVLRFETSKGAQSQMDYATYEIDFTEEGRRRVNLFGYILGYSRRQYLHFTQSQDFETTIREHVRAFTHMGALADHRRGTDRLRLGPGGACPASALATQRGGPA